MLKVGLDIIDWGFIKRAHHLSFKATGLIYLVFRVQAITDPTQSSNPSLAEQDYSYADDDHRNLRSLLHKLQDAVS